jgi:hypothetical protein
MTVLCHLNMKPEIYETLSEEQKQTFNAWKEAAEKTLNEAIVPALQRGDFSLWAFGGDVTHILVDEAVGD